MFQEYTYLFKIVVIGDSGVGKTNIVSKFVDGVFLIDEKPTIGVQFSTKVVKINDADIRCQIWDTAGQQRFRAVTKAYYNGAVGALVVFDLTSSQTFENVSKWLTEMQQNTKKDTVVLLIGNKDDLPERQVGQSKIDYFLQSSSIKISYMETSALSGHNINETFQKLIENIYTQQKKQMEALKSKIISKEIAEKHDKSEIITKQPAITSLPPLKEPNDSKIKLEPPSKEKPKKKKCC